MIYSIHEGLFSKSKNKKLSKRENDTKSYSQNNPIPKYLYIIGNDIKDALSTGDAYRSALDAVRFTLFSKYYADHIPSENKIEIPRCFANDALNMHISIYKIPSYKCNASFKYGKITISFKGSNADCIEEFNGTISDFISYNKIRAVIYDPPFKNIAECKSALSKVQKLINNEFKGVKGIKNTIPDDYEIEFFTFYKDETLYVASIDQRDSEYDLTSNEFYKLIDQGLKNINSRLQSMGLTLVDDWDKHEGMIFLTHTNKVNKPTIFSECHFMHEKQYYGLLTPVEYLIDKHKEQKEEKKRMEEMNKKYLSIPKEERDKRDKKVLECFKKMESFIKSRSSAKCTFRSLEYNKYRFSKSFYLMDNAYDEYNDRDDYLEQAFNKFLNLVFNIVESFCKSNDFDIIDSYKNTKTGEFYIEAFGKEGSIYSNIGLYIDRDSTYTPGIFDFEIYYEK